VIACLITTQREVNLNHMDIVCRRPYIFGAQSVHLDWTYLLQAVTFEAKRTAILTKEVKILSAY
jgi:hypothetical protein